MTSNELFDLTKHQLCDLIEHRGQEAISYVNELGGLKEISCKLKTSLDTGLYDCQEDIDQRKRTFGANIIVKKAPRTFLKIAWEASQDCTLIILEISALISLVLSLCQQNDDYSLDKNNSYDWIEGCAIILAVIVVILVTAINDYSKEQQFRSLKKKIDDEKKVSVIREGKTSLILVSELVVGDICRIKYGDLLYADGIVVQSNDLKVDESSLTGESDLIKKSELFDPIMLSGSRVMEGSGKFLVLAVGENSQTGIIYTLLENPESIGENKKPKSTKKIKLKGNVSNTPEEKYRRELSSNDERIITETSKNTEKINTEKRNKSILHEKLTKLAIQIGYFGSTMAILTVLILILRFCIKKLLIEGNSWRSSYYNDIVEFIIVGVTVLVVAVPEGLPLAVTISLAYSVKRMMKDNNLVRHLDACETMGNATTICSDKTGTLTTNQMMVEQIYVCSHLLTMIPDLIDIPPHVANLIISGISINSSYTSQVIQNFELNKSSKQIGNKTECALLEFVKILNGNYQIIRDNFPESIFIRVYTFNSIRKSMSTVIPLGKNNYRLYSKGASEIILKKCTYTIGENGLTEKLTTNMQKYLIRHVIFPMADSGLRTIAIAYRDFVCENPEVNEVLIDDNPDWDQEDNIIDQLTLLCIVGIEDPVRLEVPAAIQQCQKAGITVRMVTGDNKNTAKSIAIKCGILKPNSNFLILEGREFNSRIRDERGEIQQYLIDKIWPRLRVLARSSPHDKYILVKGIIESKMSKNREIVAVTGDGTNDGPALKIADVGFAMGIAGTDVAKEASDIILTDDNFNSIVKAILWGRNVYDNITKFLQFQITVNLVAIAVAFTGACVISTSPLKGVQMLWVNLVMDTFASLALATEMPSSELMLRKPYGRNASLISLTMMLNIFGNAFYQLVIIFMLMFYGGQLFDIETGIFLEPNRPTEHFTMIFNTFVVMILFNEINSRKIDGNRNVFQGIFSNLIFMIIWIGSTLFQIFIVQYGGIAFFTKTLTLEQWLWCYFLGIGTLLWSQIIISIPIHKIMKLFKKRVPSDEQILTNETNRENARLLWLRSIKRVQQQLYVINSFRNDDVSIEEARAIY